MNTIRKTVIYKHRILIILCACFMALILIMPACNQDENTVIISASNDNVSVGFYSENQSGDNNQIVITEAKFVLRKMMLERVEGDNECDVKTGPFVVYLDFDPRVAVAVISKIPLGRYDAIKFFVHKPSPNENLSDPEFIESTSSRFSFITRGFYNDIPFVYKSDITVSKRIEFENSPIDIGPILINITIRLNPYSWFTENGVILDPNIGSNRHIIDHNIKESLRRAFKDANMDGIPD